MSFPRIRLLAVLAGLFAAGAAGVLYVIHTRTVHESPVPPPTLAHLVVNGKPEAVPAVAFGKAGGARVTLAAFHGRYVLLNLWATWCAPCVRELPQLAQLGKALPGLTVVAINEGRENADDTAAFLKAHDAGALAVYVDTDAALIRDFGTQGLPFSILLDPDGHAVARALGPCDWAAPDAVAWLRQATTRPAS